MKISFQLTLDDLLAFNEHHQATSPSFRAARRRVRMVVIVLPALIIPVLAWLEVSWWWLLGAGAIIGASVPWWLGSMKRQSQTMARQLYQEGSNRRLLSPQELELATDGVINRSWFGEAKTYWRGIEKVVSTPTHTFIYLTAMTAHILPHRCVDDAQRGVFVGRLQEELGRVPPHDPPPGAA